MTPPNEIVQWQARSYRRDAQRATEHRQAVEQQAVRESS